MLDASVTPSIGTHRMCKRDEQIFQTARLSFATRFYRPATKACSGEIAPIIERSSKIHRSDSMSPRPYSLTGRRIDVDPVTRALSIHAISEAASPTVSRN